VQVQKDWADLPATMENLLADNANAKRIAGNAAAKFRDQYFTPAAQTCYFRQLFKVWAEMTTTPDPYEYETLADGSTEKRWRGMTYEEYVYVLIKLARILKECILTWLAGSMTRGTTMSIEDCITSSSAGFAITAAYSPSVTVLKISLLDHVAT
jgi:hypothetical protein